MGWNKGDWKGTIEASAVRFPSERKRAQGLRANIFGVVCRYAERGRITGKDIEVGMVGLCRMVKMSYADHCVFRTGSNKEG